MDSWKIKTLNETDTQQPQQRKKKKSLRIRKCKFQWTTLSTITLIKSVEKSDNLWNPLHPQYRNRKLHQKTWAEVAKILQLPQEEVVVKWNSLRSNYRMFLKNRRKLFDRDGKRRSPHTFFLSMAFLDPVFNIGVNLNHLNSATLDSLQNSTTECKSRPTNDLAADDTIPMVTVKLEPTDFVAEGKTEDYSFISDESSHSQCDNNQLNHSEKDASPPMTLQNLGNPKDVQKEPFDKEEDILSLQKTKLRLEIYNLQLDAFKKEKNLGMTASHFTAEIYKNWSASIRQET